MSFTKSKTKLLESIIQELNKSPSTRLQNKSRLLTKLLKKHGKSKDHLPVDLHGLS